MSHYTVCVITKDGDYGKALEPFDENLEVEPYIEKTKEQIIARRLYCGSRLSYLRGWNEKYWRNFCFANCINSDNIDADICTN